MNPHVQSSGGKQRTSDERKHECIFTTIHPSSYQRSLEHVCVLGRESTTTQLRELHESTPANATWEAIPISSTVTAGKMTVCAMEGLVRCPPEFVVPFALLFFGVACYPACARAHSGCEGSLPCGVAITEGLVSSFKAVERGRWKSWKFSSAIGFCVVQ